MLVVGVQRKSDLRDQRLSGGQPGPRLVDVAARRREAGAVELEPRSVMSGVRRLLELVEAVRGRLEIAEVELDPTEVVQLVRRRALVAELARELEAPRVQVSSRCLITTESRTCRLEMERPRLGTPASGNVSRGRSHSPTLHGQEGIQRSEHRAPWRRVPVISLGRVR